MTEPFDESQKMKKPITIVMVFTLVVALIIGILLYERIFSGTKKQLDGTPSISNVQETQVDEETEEEQETMPAVPDAKELKERIAHRKTAPNP